MTPLNPAKTLEKLLILLLLVFCISCNFSHKPNQETRTITDQLGRQVKVPQHPKKRKNFSHG